MTIQKVHITELNLMDYAKRIIEAHENGFVTVSAGKAGANYVMNMEKVLETATKIEGIEPTLAPEDDLALNPPVEEDSSEDVEDEAEVEVEAADVDWKKVKSLTDKKELEEYAREFGIELSRRKSLQNMVKSFEEACKA